MKARPHGTGARSGRDVTTSARAVVSDGRGGFAVAEVEIRDPEPEEVLVDVKASGICHTDHDLLSVPVALVLGHEGAGTVAADGDARA